MKKLLKVLTAILCAAILGVGVYIYMNRETPPEPVYYKYLAIGNSITYHSKCDYWFSERGMAASSDDKDYYSLVVSYLKEKHIGIDADEVIANRYLFYVWEVQYTDRSETLTLLDPYLSEDLNLITIQLGENVSEYATYEKDYLALINCLKDKCPNAEIILVEDFWKVIERSEVKQRVATETNIGYADINSIQELDEYMCGMDTIIYDDEGNSFVNEHNGVALHPGDKGMEYIANKIIEVLETLEILEEEEESVQ